MWKYVLWYYDQMDSILVLSKSSKEELKAKGINPKKIRLVPRGIDIERFHPTRDSDWLEKNYGLGRGIRLLYVGRISKEKNLPMLCKVFKSLITLHNCVSLVIVGDGPYLSEMKEELEGTPVVFTGYLEGEALSSTYASCDLFVFPSATDTFGNVIMEAQASGLPVIVTDSGGPKENIIPDKTGLVVPSDNCEELLAAIQSLIVDSDKLKQMRKEARKYMEKRSFNKSFEKMWQIYEEDLPVLESSKVV
jgi:glycosyltransferase involved in cell wall biosynthesis